MTRISWLPLLIGVVLSAANAAGQNATANIQPAQADVFQTTVNYVGEFYPLWFIVNDYLNHTGPTNWITYTNIGIWAPNEFIQRSSITQYIQYANDHETAAYFHTFKDANGSLLDGTDPKDYVLKFSKKEIPTAKRFRSLTAYAPEAIELVPNSANKYVVASYIPPEVNLDGSISIYMTRQIPPGVKTANWLPIPPGPFNIILRVYGPEQGLKITPMCLRLSRRFTKFAGFENSKY